MFANATKKRAGAIRVVSKTDPTVGSVACDCYTPPQIWGTNRGLVVPDSHTDEYIHFQIVTLPKHDREVVAAAAKAAGVTIIWRLKLSMQKPDGRCTTRVCSSVAIARLKLNRKPGRQLERWLDVFMKSLNEGWPRLCAVKHT